MRVFVYEFITGGGMWSTGSAPAGSLLSEGAAMAQSIGADFVDCGSDVWSMLDTRLIESGQCQVEQQNPRSEAPRGSDRLEPTLGLADHPDAALRLEQPKAGVSISNLVLRDDDRDR